MITCVEVKCMTITEPRQSKGGEQWKLEWGLMKQRIEKQQRANKPKVNYLKGTTKLIAF